MLNDKYNFNLNEDIVDYQLIPEKTICKVRLEIKKGGYDNISIGWTNGYVTMNSKGSCYLSVEYKVLEVCGNKELNETFKNHKIFDFIGLHSETSKNYGNIGRSTIRKIVDAAYCLKAIDISPYATQKRNLTNGFGELDGLEFFIEVGQKISQDGKVFNSLKNVLLIDNPLHPHYLNENDSRSLNYVLDKSDAHQVTEKINQDIFEQHKNIKQVKENTNEPFIEDEVPF